MLNRKKVEEIYEECCQIADSKNVNPCGFKCGKCHNGLKNGCCRFCHLVTDDKGCSSSNLTCKLFNCTSVTSRYECVTIKDLPRLKELSFRQRVIIKHDYFCSRKEAIDDLMFDSITIFVIRMLWRRIYNFIKYKGL